MLYGNRVIVPFMDRAQVLKMLHLAHPGIACMKSFARGYVGWPGFDQEMERYIKLCEVCQINQKLAWPDKP